MTHAPPIPLAYHGEGTFKVTSPYWGRLADRYFVAGEISPMVRHEQRSINSHNHFFAAIEAAWQNLPDALAIEFPSPEALRKFALIRTGHCDSRSVTCSSAAEARKIVGFIKAFDQYAVVDIKGDVVTHFTARSQSYRAMNKAVFAQSKADVLAYIAGMIGTTPEQLVANSGKSSEGQR